ncbi:MAG TPA: ABC transporter substrate-binding protein [Burkholderiaceae bacterium]|nr:ABC transporter substrate-binding protein [Burkholderiaceae bacterium]
MSFRHLSAALAAAAALALAATAPASAQVRGKDAVVMAMALEPTGLDPTTSAAAAIGEIVHYNVLETLVKIREDGSIAPLLAEKWTVSPDARTFTFELRKGVRFHNGEPFGADTVKFAFERAAAADSTNKDKPTYANIEAIRVTDPHVVAIRLKTNNPDFLFHVGLSTAVIVEPRSASTNATNPVGTGPYRVENWVRGSSLTLAKWPGYRDADRIRMSRVTWRFISDPAAQIAAILAGDVDAMPRITAKAIDAVKGDPRFTVRVGGSRAKPIRAINNRKKPLDDVRVRRAIAMAIDRKAVIIGAADGYGVPIGSHYVPGAFGYVDTTGVNPFDPAKAKALLAEAGVKTPLELTLKLPPPPYSRQGGEVIAAQLAKVGIVAKIQNVEWAQWMSGVYTNRDYDLTIISHVEPLDLGNYAKDNYYWNYESPKFRALFARISSTGDDAERARLLGEAQRLIAQESPNVFLYQPQWVSVANARLVGLWKDVPIFANDLSLLHWK